MRKLFLALGFVLLLLSFWGSQLWQIGVCFLMVVILGSYNRKALAAGSWKFWIFPLFFVFLLPFTAPESDIKLFGLDYNPKEIIRGAAFLLHAYSLFVFINYVGVAFTTSETVAFFERLGMKALGLRLALAIHSVKIVRGIIFQVFDAFVLEYPERKQQLKHFYIFLGALLRNSASTADNISILFYMRKIKL